MLDLIGTTVNIVDGVLNLNGKSDLPCLDFAKELLISYCNKDS